MSSYRFTVKANRDLERTTNYIFRLNPSAADNFLTRVDETCRLLASQPGIGRPRPELGDNLRSLPIGNFLMFYVPAQDGIVITRILYGGRDIPREFQ